MAILGKRRAGLHTEKQDMSLYKPKTSRNWWCRVYVSGREIRRSTRTPVKSKARQYEAKLRSQLWEQVNLGEIGPYTWDDAVARWQEETDKKTDWKDRQMLTWFAPYLSGELLRNISPQTIDKCRKLLLREVSKSTVNRYMALLRAILNKAVEWGMLAVAPKTPMYHVRPPEVRWITPEEFGLLVSYLPTHQAAMARFAVSTGLRQDNVRRLTWPQIDLNRNHAIIPGYESKSGSPIPVPLNADAMRVLLEEIGKHLIRVFTYKGQPISQVNTKAWRRAVAKAGLKPFRWHDLRHTWATWHVHAGTPLHVLRELGGWSSYDMVLRYAHLSSDHLAEYAHNLTRIKTGIPDKGGAGNGGYGWTRTTDLSIMSRKGKRQTH